MNNLTPDSPIRYDRLTMTLHWLTAVLVIGMFASAQAEPLNFFDLFDAPTLISFDKSMKSVFGGLHEQVAWAIVILAGLHALIALVHHYGLRDNTLRRMLPGHGSN
ncbi:cytochrome b [Pseudomonas sp. LB3P81]